MNRPNRRKSRRKLRSLSLAVPLLVAAGMSQASCTSEPAEEPTGESFTKLAYVVRQHTVQGGDGVNINVAGGMGQVMDYLRYMPGARIELKDLGSGDIENILEDKRFAQADVQSMNISFDAKQIVFSMKMNRDDKYHIYTAKLERVNGAFEIHQLTFGDADDIYPVWLAGGKIAFVTNQGYTEMGTRADEYNHSRIVTQIATITAVGGDADRKLCSQNLSHTINLSALKDGRLLFSRWEHLGERNDVKLFAMNPDCTQMTAISGEHGKPGNSLVQVSESNDTNVFLAVVTSRENTIQSGALVRINAQSAVDRTRADEESPEYEVLTPAVPRAEEPSPVGRYRYPVSLPDGRILASWAKGEVNELNELALQPPDFGIYIYNPETRSNELVVNHEDTWELYGQAVTPREEPPIIASVQDSQDATKPMVLGSIDVKQTSLFAKHGNTVDGAQFDGTPLDEALRQADRVRIVEGFSSEAGGERMFGLTMSEGAAVLGEAKVQEDGSWLAAIPPYVPVHLQPIDEFDLMIRDQKTWIQGMPGEDRVCGGCHEDRTAPNLPGGQALTIAASKGAEDFMVPVGERVEYPWAYANDPADTNEIQKLLNAKCSSCHNESTNGSGAQEFYEVTMTNETTGEATSFRIPRMDLSDRPITVTYDNETKAWPASYVSIFYPAALEMEMSMGETTIVGTIPPLWGVPADGRNSKLIEKLNITSVYDSNKTAWPLGQPFSADIRGGQRTIHPDDVGVTLTREERVKLIRVMDMGGQFYARKNMNFEPYANNPVSGKQY